MKILKFGGSSVGNSERINGVINIIIDSLKKNDKIGVVFSAFQGVTDLLIEAGNKAANGDISYIDIYELLYKKHIDTLNELNETVSKNNNLDIVSENLKELQDLLKGIFLIKELTPKTLDYLMSFGERLSCKIISFSLNSRNVETNFCDARRIIKTDESFGTGKVNFKETDKLIVEYFNQVNKTQIITGFISSTANNETTTLGRGGSDFTASIIGAALGVEEIEIWTDVEGVLTSDPRKVKNAFSVDSLTYEEAMELSHFGAKVIHPPTMFPAMIKGIPIRIKNTFNPDFIGTVIGVKQKNEKYTITGISSIDHISLLRVQGPGMVGVAGISKRLFGVLASGGINIILITQASSEHSICFAVLPTVCKKAKRLIEQEFIYEIKDGLVNEIIIEENLSIIAVVGENMRSTAGIAGKVFQALGNNNINLTAIAQGSSELNISMVIENINLTKALNVIHNNFFTNGCKQVNIFIAGMGNISGAFFDIIKDRITILKEKQNVKLQIIGIANSSKYYINYEGIDLNNYKSVFYDKSNDNVDDEYINKIIQSDIKNKVFIDCTTSEKVSAKYLGLLENNIKVVTANKKANSGDYDYYKKLNVYSNGNASYYYETNVCAGLPVISTIKDLMKSGDNVERIEAVLSGTISYIFNNFESGKLFSEIIEEARLNGYTEPDPRDDLNGTDVLRKLLILVREIGFGVEYNDIELQNLLPNELFNAKTYVDFQEGLINYDSIIKQKRDSALKENKVLRYIAEYKNGRAEINLRAVGKDSPFYSLKKTDNMVVIYTQNYNDSPLVIQGPGAGAKVTANGVFIDLLKLINNID